jgi:signal transduction histidine kinase
VYRGEWARAVDSLRQAEVLTWSAPAHINVADCHLHLALALAHAGPSHAEGPGLLSAVSGHLERFAHWAGLNPLTFRNKLLLIDAEVFRLRGDAMRALSCYEQSARVAAASGFVHEQALASELAAGLCVANGLPDSALHHARAARDAYRRWGADHKADQLSRQYPELGAADAGGPRQAMAEPARLAGGWGLGMRAAQAITSERVMDRLIESLMADVVVHAGAQYALLLLMRGDRPVIEASGRVVDGAVSITLGAVEPNDELLPLNVLNSVLRARQTFALADASAEAPSIRMRGASARRLRSLLCLPLVRGGTLIGAFYLENNLAPGVFDAGRIADLEVLAPQVAISLETARLYEQLIDENDRRLAAEMGLRTARAELARTSQLTVMGTLAASIAHEVNQPLTAIVASVDASLRWLNRATPNLGEVQDGLAHIRKNGLRAAEIIRALRALAKQAPLVMTSLAPDEVLREVLDMVRMEIAGHGVRVLPSLGAGGTLVAADRVQLQQVMLNLITNAIDAMAGSPPDARELVIASARDGPEVVIRVEDAGHGIPEAMRLRLFDPFMTTKQSGMGMGLAICKSIVEAHGGELEVAPRDGGGTVFMFRLPVLGSATRP